MTVRKNHLITAAASALLALTASSSALAGGTAAGAASGASVAGSASIPSSSMSFFSGALTTGGGVTGGGATPAGPTTQTVNIPAPPSLSGILGGFSPGSQVTLQGPSGSFVVTVGSGGTIESVSRAGQ